VEEYAATFSLEEVMLSPSEWEAARRKLDFAGELAGISCLLSSKIKNKIIGKSVFDDKEKITIYLRGDQKALIDDIDGIIDRLLRKNEIRTH
jgi:hypothetical protein